jgi:CrcB protein
VQSANQHYILIKYRLEKEEETYLNGKWGNILAIGIGGSIGTISRYYLSVITFDTGYPIGTILVNLIGSLLLGFLTAWFIIFVPKEWIKLGLGVGLCGGFTTMSTFAADATFLYLTYSPFESALYVFSSMLGGISFAFMGYFIGTLVAKKTDQKQKKVNEG